MQPLSSAHHVTPGTTANPGYAAPAPSGTSGGFSVAVLPIITTFLSSLSPGYTPERIRQKSLVSDSGETVVSRKNWQDSTNDAVQKLKLACTIASCWVPQVKVVSDAVASISSSFSLAHDLGSVLKDKEGKKNRAPGTATLSGSAAAALTLVALDSLTTAAATPAAGERGSAQNPIPVPDSETLSKIGQDGYPTDAYYIQNDSFTHNGIVPGASFRGHYDGGCRTINDLHTCLFSNLEPYAEVRNLRLANATMDTDRQYLALLACEMAPHSLVSNITVEHVNITNRARGNDSAPAATGVISGHQQWSSRVMATNVRHCSVSTTGDHSMAGVLGGLVNGLNQDAVVGHCRVETSGHHAPAGIGAGKLSGLTKDMTVLDSQVTTSGESSVAGVGAGLALGVLEQVGVVNGRVRTSGKRAFAAIGAGQVGYPRSLDYGLIDGLLSVNGSVITGGERASAGIGTGQLNGETNLVTSVNSTVLARGDMASAGIGNGDSEVNTESGENRNLVIVNSLVDTEGGGDAGMVQGIVRNLTIVNSRLRDRLVRDEGSVDLSKLCAEADSRFIASDCTIKRGPTHWNSASLAPCDGSFRVPIEISDAESLNRIGLSPDYPPYAHYVQTGDLNGTQVNTSRSLTFTGHYNGQNHTIRDLQTCLFSNLRGTLRNLHLTGARVSSVGQGAAVLACRMSDASTVDNITFSDCQVTTRGPAPAGIVSAERQGRANQVTRIKVHSAMVATDGDAAHAGVIAGQCHGQTRQVDIAGSRVITHGEGACAGVGGGPVQGRFDDASFLCSQAGTTGREARAGIGAGRVAYGRVGPMTVIQGAVNTTGVLAHAGIGAGEIDKFGAAGDITSLQSQVMTSGLDADAGIGAGVLDAVRFGRAMGIDAIDCEVHTRGPQTHAGVGVGSLRLQASDTEPYAVRLANFTSINNTVKASGVRSHASINGLFLNRNGVAGEARLPSTVALNTRVNDRIYDRGYVNKDGLCAKADPRFVNPNCQPRPFSLAQSCSLPSVVAVATPAGVAPALVAASPGVVAGLILGSFVLFGGSALAAYLYTRHRREQEARAVPDESLSEPPVDPDDK